MMLQSTTNVYSTVLVLAAAVVVATEGFVPLTNTIASHGPSATTTTTTQRSGIFDKVGAFFEELDAFVDDATSRRLGNGSKFYGKRRSNFYGEQDADRKRDRTVADPTGEFVEFGVQSYTHAYTHIKRKDQYCIASERPTHSCHTHHYLLLFGCLLSRSY